MAFGGGDFQHASASRTLIVHLHGHVTAEPYQIISVGSGPRFCDPVLSS
jgi:hypothetical protein